MAKYSLFSTDTVELSIDVGDVLVGGVVLCIGESLTEDSAAGDDEEDTVMVLVAGGPSTVTGDDEEETGVVVAAGGPPTVAGDEK